MSGRPEKDRGSSAPRGAPTPPGSAGSAGCRAFEAKLLEKLRSDFLDRRWVRGPQAEAEIRGRRPCRPSQDWSFRDLTQAAVLNDVGSIVSKAHPGKWQHC